MTSSWFERDTVESESQDIILVNESDQPVGLGIKSEVHQRGELHRAFSVFIANQRGEWLLQQRAADKYHSSCLWSNACCSHPRPGENVYEAARRRVVEELGVEIELEYLGYLIYSIQFEDGLWEHEYDHLFWAVCEGPFSPDPREVDAVRWIDPGQLRLELEANPDQFTFWFRAVLDGKATGPGVDKLLPAQR